ncbi:UPF0158 family protein [Peribacillus sp. JNUCC 23]
MDGKGAFRRFKDVLIDLNLEEEWYSFKESSYRILAIRWCEDQGIEYIE